jgi:hypothetical protein
MDVMPDQLNKQSLINLLIDSPLREPIKINLIDIVNNTSEPDLPKVYSTITKELEIFQKATERRMKLAEETIAKLSDTPPTPETPASTDSIAPSMSESTTNSPMPMQPTPQATTSPVETVTAPMPVEPPAPLAVPPLDLPPLPQTPSVEPVIPPATPVVDTPMPASPTPSPALTPLGGAPVTASSDEDALAEIQKELDSLKTTTANEISTAATPTPTPALATPAPQA